MVVSVAAVAVAVVESAIAGKQLALIETPEESPAQTVPHLPFNGITRRGPEFIRITEVHMSASDFLIWGHGLGDVAKGPMTRMEPLSGNPSHEAAPLQREHHLIHGRRSHLEEP